MKFFTRAAYVKHFFAFITLLFTLSLGYGQTTYTWIGASGGSWATSTNWSPTRASAIATDILVFNDGGTYNISGIPTTQTLRQLLITNNTTINLQQTAAAALTIIGPTLTNNLVIEQGSTLSMSSTAAFSITMTTTANQRADISGTLAVNTNCTFATNGATTNLFTISSTGVVNHYGGTITATAATCNFTAGANYNYLSATVGLTIPTASWDVAANCNITGVTSGTTLTAGFSGATGVSSFGNFTVNCPSQTSTFNLLNATTTTTIKGNLNIVNTGTGGVTIKSATTLSTVTVNGNVNISGGQLNLNTGTTSASNLTVNGDFNLSGGIFEMSTAAIACALNIDGNYNQTGGTLRQTSTTASAINFRGVNKTFYKDAAATLNNANINFAINTSGASLTLLSDMAIPTGRNFTVTNGTLYCGTYTISGAGTFATSTGNATLALASPAGITTSPTALGNIQTTTRTFATASNYMYYGDNGQATGNALLGTVTGSIYVNLSSPSALLTVTNPTLSGSGVNLRFMQGSLFGPVTFTGARSILTYEGTAAQTSTNNEFPAASGPKKLVINNTAGVNMHAARTIDSLTLIDGILNTAGNTLSVTNTNSGGISGGSATSYVRGNLVRSLPTGLSSAVPYTFPIGKSSYQQITLNPRTTNTTTVSAEVFDADAGGTPDYGVASLSTNRYWRIAASNGNLASAGPVAVTETGLTSNNKLCFSTTQTGAYTITASDVSGDLISTTDPILQPAGASMVAYYVVGSAGTISGTIPVGNSSAVKKLYQIANLLNSNTLTSDVVFELQPDYDGTTGEIFPINFYQYNTSGGAWKATVRPAAGATNLVTSGKPASSTAFVAYNGVDNLTFDGRPGGTGSSIQWILRNMQTSTTYTPTLQLINDATYNKIQYVQLESQNAISSNGTVVIGTTTGTTGNDYNTIQYCNIRERSDTTATPWNGIYAVGLLNKENDHNTIAYNNIFNYWGTNSSGINISSYNTDYNIVGNSFYQTVTRAGVAGTTHFGINVSSAISVANITVDSNYIGGTAPKTGGGYWTHNSATTSVFNAINMNGITSGSNNIRGNYISKISWQCSSNSSTLPGIFTGIYSTNGGAYIDGNTVGGASGNDSIVVTSGTSNASVYGIGQFGTTGDLIITNNKIGAIRTAGTSTTISVNLVGIQAGGANSRIVANNQIGSLTTTNSLFASTAATGTTSTAAQTVVGINIPSANTAMQVYNNTIANLRNAYVGSYSAAITAGIIAINGKGSISNNIITAISSDGAVLGSAGNVVAGIQYTTITASDTVSGNTISNLKSNTGTAAVSLVGLSYSGATSGTNIVEKNLIHSLALASSNGTASITGIHSVGGLTMFRNNMIRLGIDELGNNVTPTCSIVGINKASTSINRFYHNSIYIGGTAGATTANTYAFRRTAGPVADTIKNNIFSNVRICTGTGLHFSIGLVANTAITAANCNYNMYECAASTSGGRVGQIAAGNSITFTDWKTNSTFDQNSYFGAPGFINPTGNASSVDLHINPSIPTQVESNAIPIGSVTDDFDGDQRTSPDIGADEGNFTPIDLSPPVITYSTFGNACNDAVTYTVSVTDISDASGVNTTSGTAPRIYYKKTRDTNNAYNGNTSATTGWKYVEATNTTAPYSFNINFSLLNGGITYNDTIQYFIIAQDLATPNPANIGISTGTTLNNAPSSVALTSASFPVSGTQAFFVISPCSGTVTVGTGGNYEAFTTANGIFNAVNFAPPLTGSLTFNVISDIAIETGAVALNQWSETGIGGYTITIQSNSNVNRDISSIPTGYAGATIATNGLFRMNGADRVTFNGGTGTNRYLTFRNTATGTTSTFAATFSFLADATNNTINNCIVEGAPVNTQNGVIYFGTGTSTGNDNNTVTNCDIRDVTKTPFPTPNNAIFSLGSAGFANTNTISNNNIFNFFSATGVSCGILLSTNNSAWTITNNRFYQTAARLTHASDQFVISINDAANGGHNISNNIIGYADNLGTGTYSLGNTTTSRFTGIQATVATLAPFTTIADNRIESIQVTSSSGSSNVFTGISIPAGTAVITGNIIGSANANSNIRVSSTANGGVVNGILIGASTASSMNISNNTIGGFDVSGITTANTGISFYGINFSSTTGGGTISGNTIGSTTIANSINLSSNATTSTFYLYGIRLASSGSYYPSISNNIISNLINNGKSTFSYTAGIMLTSAAQYTVTGNEVSNITSASLATGTTSSTSLLGIYYSSSNTLLNQLSGNKVYNLSLASSTVSHVTGIYYAGGTLATNVVSKNLVYNIYAASNTASIATGLYLNSVGIVSNNMVRMGYKNTGASADSVGLIYGIYKDGAYSTRILFNSVYVGGTSSLPAASSYAFRKNSINLDTLRNNIFVNERSGGTTSKHYAISCTTSVATNLISNYNIAYAPAANGVAFNRTTAAGDYNTVAGWNSITTQDANSIVGSPNFVSPTTTVPDLHIQSPTITESNGTFISYITDDYDGDDRSLNTPTDIGADAGQFAPIDVFPPSISYTAYTNTCNDAPYTVSATITDNVAVSTASGTEPRIYFKRTSDPNTYNDNTSSTQGWKYVVATNSGSPFSYTIDFNLLYGGPHANDTIQYFVIAQDASANTTINSGTIGLTSAANGVALSAANFPTTGTLNQFVLWPCSGVVTVGTGGNYGVFTTANGVFKAINDAPGLNGNLTLKVISDITIEDGLHGLNQWLENGIGGYTVTIEPDANILRSVSGTSGSNLGLFRINGADRVRFNGGTGTDKYLKISNTLAGANASTINIINDATDIIINNCILEGGANSTAHGVVTIGASATAGNGNDNISISTCDIKAYNTNYPTYGIYAANTVSGTNNNVTINDCNIYDNYSASVAPSAILIGTGNSGWTISNNRIYQTIARSTAGALLYTGIRVNNTATGGFTITGNQIGGTDALGNNAMSYSSTGAMQYGGIYFSSVATLQSLISGNTIKNISVASTYATVGANSNAFSGIYIVTPSAVNISNNTIGSTTDTASIAVTINANAGVVNGIKTESATAITINNNTVAGMKATATSTNGISLIGISVTLGSDSITNNTIGSTLIANSMMVRGAATTNTSLAAGIVTAYAAAYSPVIKDNVVKNISNLITTGTTGNQQAAGILASGTTVAGTYNIIGNTVSDITGSSTSANAGSSSSVLGISAIGGVTAHNIISNTVYNLRNNSISGTPAVTGINYSGGAGIANLSKNWVYNIQSNIVASSVVTGMQLTTACIASNNMVRLGYDVTGQPIADATIINGILKDGTVNTRIYFNSIYIGGAASIGAANTYAFRKTTPTLDSVKNNIFVNERSGGTGKHYAASYYNTTTASINSNYNVLYAPATNGVLFGVINPALVDYTQQVWNSTSAQDANSIVGAPNYVSPTTAVPDLHVQSPTISEGSGIVISYITEDFDGDNRSLNTPTDIGADAGLNMFSDNFAPTISYTAIPIQDICNIQPINIQVTVTDIHTGISLTNNKPRMYLRKSVGSTANAWGIYQSIEGTFVSGNTNVSVWNFVVDFSLLGTPVTQGDEFEYYFVAQDAAPIFNVGYSQQSNGTPLHSDVLTVITAPNFALNSSGTFAFNNPLSGIVTVGTGGTYSTFNGPNGLFAALNTRGLSGNLTVNVVSHIDESNLFTVLGPIPEYCGSGYKVLVQSSTATVRNVYQNSGGRPMLNFAGCKNIEFNGTNNGTGKYLLLSQRQNYPTIHVNGHTTNATDLITFESCVIEGNNRAVDTGYGLGVVSLGGIKGAGQAIKNITLNNNTISNLSHLNQDAAIAPGTLVYVGNYLGSSSTVVNSFNIKIKNNELFNFYESAVQVRQNLNGYGIGDSIFIDSNNIYEPLDFATYQYPIWLEGGNNSKGHSITRNTIGGNLAPNTNMNGTWTNTKVDGEIVAIYTLVGGNTAGSGVNIANNTVGNMTLLGTGYTNFIGIRNEQGAANIYKNTIGSTTALNCIVNNGCGSTDVYVNSATIGIWNQSTTEAKINNNKIANINTTFNAVQPYQFVAGILHGSNHAFNNTDYFNSPAGKGEVNNNEIFNLNSASRVYEALRPDALIGIFFFGRNGLSGNSISGNKVYSLNNITSWTSTANTSTIGISAGLMLYGSSQSGIISNNTIYGLSNDSRALNPRIYGCTLAGGNWNVNNNMISISNATYPNAGPYISGIEDWTVQGNTIRIYHNTVYISGNVGYNSNSSYCYRRAPNNLSITNQDWGANIDIKNNIFYNDRFGNSTPNVSIANLTVGNSSDALVGWSSNYNFLISQNTSQVGRWITANTSGNRTFANWQTTTSGDANSLTATVTNTSSSATSVNAAELFVSPATGDLHINTAFTPYPKDFVSNRGTGLASVIVDIDNDPRNASTPDLGCDEFSDCSAPVISLSANGANGNTAVCSGSTSINLITTPTGAGNGCAGAFEYAISNGSLYWNGSSFASATAIYNNSYNNINFNAVTSGSYTATIACSSDQSCRNISSTIMVGILDTVATVSATIGTPANGTSHNMNVSWAAVNGATGYDIDYSNNGNSWTTIATNVTGTTYSHNTGDSPNLPTYYRVKPRTGTMTCSYTAMTTPVYTACDTPALPIITNLGSSTLDITLQVESPVANPSYTTYSIYNPSTNQYVQADGTLGATEVFQTASQWGTITVTGLTTNTSYCFYTTAQNMDGDKRSSTLPALSVQQFNSNVFTQNSALQNMWFAPNNYTPISYIASGGCNGGRAGYSGSYNSFWGNFIRTPIINCTGMSQVVMSFDISNSYFLTQLNDYVRFYMWDGYGSSTSYRATSVKVNGVEVSVSDINGIKLLFNQARTCQRVDVTFDFNAVGYPTAYKDKVFFFLEAQCNYNNANVYSVYFDNITINSSPATACATTLNCTTPVIITQPATPSPICAGVGATTISVATTGTGLTYQWRRNGSNIVLGGVYAVNSTANTSTLTITNPALVDTGSYDVVVSNACSQTVTSNAVNLNVHQSISGLTIGSNSPVCEWSDANFTSAVLTGNGLTYNWSGPNGFTSNIAAPTKPMMQEYVNEGSYTLTVSNTCNSTTASVQVYVHPAVIDLVAFTSTSQICEGDTLTLGAAHINAIAVSDIQWQWTGPNGFTATTKQTLDPTPTISGVYTVNAINACGTFTANTPYITVDTVIEADAGPDVITNVCGALSIQLQAVGNGVWTEINGTSSSFSPSDATNNATVTSNGYGLKQYRWTVTNGACTSEDDARYYFNPAITTTVSLEGCNFTNGDTVLVAVTANGGSSTLGITPPVGSELIIPNVTSNTSIYTMPMDGTVRSYTISDGICSTPGTITPPPTHPTDIPYKNSQGFATADCYGNGFNKWLTFRDTNNDAILSVNDNGNNLGKITAAVYRDAVEPVITQTSIGGCENTAQVAMKRHFVLQSNAQQPFASDVSLRLYFSQNELNDLVAASQANDLPGDDCSTYDNLTGLSDLYVTKYSGTDEDGDYMNNAPDGIYRVYASGSTMQAAPSGFATLFTNGDNHHYVELNVREFSELWLHGSITGSALPVEMLYLKADAVENKYIQLTWATALEIDNNGFVVERSTDAQNWNTIGWVDGNNNSTIQQSYVYDDYNVTEGIVYYYRLKQVDNDGAYEYTGIVSAKLNTTNQVLTVTDFIPNPAINTTQLVVISPAQQEIGLEVFDVLGRKVVAGNHLLNKGSNTIPFAVNAWAAGTYTAVVIFGNETYSKKLVVIK